VELSRYTLGDTTVIEGWLNRGGKKKHFALIELESIVNPQIPKVDARRNLREEIKKTRPEEKKVAKEQIISDVEELFGIEISSEWIEWIKGLWKEYGLSIEQYNEKHIVLSILSVLFLEEFKAK